MRGKCSVGEPVKDEVRSYALSVALGKEIARRGIPAFIETSTAHVYKVARVVGAVDVG
jgi:hypothetical protein